MQIDIQFRGLDTSPAMREHAERRTQFTLGRHSARIARVSISLADINGPKGGADKSCTVQISLQQVIDRGLARAGRTMVRRMERQTRQRYAPRGEHQPAEAESA